MAPALSVTASQVQWHQILIWHRTWAAWVHFITNSLSNPLDLMTTAPLLSHQSVTLTQLLGQFKGKETVLQRTDYCRMNRRKAGLNLITKDRTIQSGERTSSLRWPRSIGCVDVLCMVSVQGRPRIIPHVVFGLTVQSLWHSSIYIPFITEFLSA